MIDIMITSPHTGVCNGGKFWTRYFRKDYYVVIYVVMFRMQIDEMICINIEKLTLIEYFTSRF